MSKDEREFLDDLRKKSIEAAAEIMASLQRLKLLYDEISDDGSGEPMPRPKVGDFFYRLARFELEHASNVIRLGNAQAELIFDHVRQLARRTRGASGGVVSTAVVTLAPDGEGRLTGGFEIRSPFASEADVRFEVGPLRDASGAEKTAVKVAVTCGNGRVAAYQTARVELAVDKAAVEQTLFGEITVYLSAEIERQVAHRAIKVRSAP